MKTITLIAITTLTLLSGCGSQSSSQSNSATKTSSDTAPTEVIVLSAKSEIIVEENRVNSNTSYTHVGTSGARYTFE